MQYSPPSRGVSHAGRMPLVTVSPASQPNTRYVLTPDDPGSEASITLLEDPRDIKAAMVSGSMIGAAAAGNQVNGGARRQNGEACRAVQGASKKPSGRVRRRKAREEDDRATLEMNYPVPTSLTDAFEPGALMKEEEDDYKAEEEEPGLGLGLEQEMQENSGEGDDNKEGGDQKEEEEVVYKGRGGGQPTIAQ